MNTFNKVIACLGTGLGLISLGGCYEVDYGNGYYAPPHVTVSPNGDNSSPYYGTPTNNSTPSYGPPPSQSVPSYGPPPANVTVSPSGNSSVPSYGPPPAANSSDPHYGAPSADNSTPHYGPASQVVHAGTTNHTAPVVTTSSANADQIAQPGPSYGVIPVEKTSEMRRDISSGQKPLVVVSSNKADNSAQSSSKPKDLPDVK